MENHDKIFVVNISHATNVGINHRRYTVNIDYSYVMRDKKYYMTPELFKATDYFQNYTREKWGDYRYIRVPLVYWLDELRDIAGNSLIIHCAYEDREDGYHPMGMACDFHIKGLSVVDQFLLASKIPFGGIGVYPHWNSPGLHCDIRPLSTGIRYCWVRNKYGEYRSLDKIEQIR